MRRWQKLLVATGVASLFTLWTAWPPFAPEETRGIGNDELAVKVLLGGAWIGWAIMTLIAIKWLEEE